MEIDAVVGMVTGEDSSKLPLATPTPKSPFLKPGNPGMGREMLLTKAQVWGKPAEGGRDVGDGVGIQMLLV